MALETVKKDGRDFGVTQKESGAPFDGNAAFMICNVFSLRIAKQSIRRKVKGTQFPSGVWGSAPMQPLKEAL